MEMKVSLMVNDFNILDKNHMYTLNLCATQILSRKMEEERHMIIDLETRLARLEAYMN
jgi:hypothetical protein